MQKEEGLGVPACYMLLIIKHIRSMYGASENKYKRVCHKFMIHPILVVGKDRICC